MVDKEAVIEAANYFKEEILEIMSDIPSDKLADMVALYIYYQQGINKDEARAIVAETCGITT